MIVSDGITWTSSKNIKAVGQFKDGCFNVYVDGIGPLALRYVDDIRGYAIRANLILGLDAIPGKLEETVQLLLDQARQLGYDADAIIKIMKELQGESV